jgi:hypothetical protein
MVHIVHAVMLVVEHGGRRGAILVGIVLGSFLSLVATQIIVNWAQEDQESYTTHAWPKSLAVAVPGLACGVTGLVLLPAHQKARERRVPVESAAKRESGRLDVILKRYFDLLICMWGLLLLGVAAVNLLISD